MLQAKSRNFCNFFFLRQFNFHCSQLFLPATFKNLQNFFLFLFSLSLRYSVSLRIQSECEKMREKCGAGQIRIRLTPATLLKKRVWHSCFPMNFETKLRIHIIPEKFLRTPFLENACGRLLLQLPF